MRLHQFVVTIATSALLLGVAMTQEPPKPSPTPPAKQQDPRAELKDRMAARYPLVSALRDAGKLGETPSGEVKLVKAEFGTEKADPKDATKGSVAEVVAAENKDRQSLYAMVAKEMKLTPAEVGKQNGARNFEKASPDHWIEVDGKWVQRKTVKPVTREKPAEKPAEKPPAKQ